MARSYKNKDTSKNKRWDSKRDIDKYEPLNNGFVLPEFIYRFVTPEQIKRLVLESSARIEHKRD